MPYKVFFVEDEIVTREGIRDNVDWKANGFEFCGEASDGEMALPLLQTTRPDVLITDIKMPFMDGLQMCKIVRERLPWIKIIILSGHDEFEYARKAIELGVTEYLLKPVTIQDLHQVLQKTAVLLDREKIEQDHLKELHAQVEENQSALREKLLLKLVLGAISSSDAIEKGQSLGLDLVARCYLVVMLKIELGDRSEQFDYDEYQRIQELIGNQVENNPDVFLLKKDWEELVLLMKGGSPEYLDEEKELLLELIKKHLKGTRYRLTVGTGAPQKRIADIYHSFVQALASLQGTTPNAKAAPDQFVDQAELLKVDKAAVENYLSAGTREGFENFFETYIGPLGETTLRSSLIKNYLFVDVIIATAKLVKEWGGEISLVVPELNSVETILMNIKGIAQLREQTRKILISALTFRDSLAGTQHTRLIHQAREFIERAYMEPDLCLSDVAASVNLSPSHFSVVFGQETGQNFKDYLTGVRIQKARELLCSTALKSTDIASLVGYNDPHYFSTVFKKNSGFSPSEFRSRARVA